MKLLKLVFVLFIVAACSSGEMREGDQLFEDGKYQQAIAAYNEYLGSHQADVATLYNRGRSYEEVGNFGLALQDFEAVIKMDKRNVNAYLSMTKVYYNQEKYSLALVTVGKALDLNENSAQGNFLQGRCRHQLGYFDQALESYSLAIKLNREFGEAYLYRGALKVQLNKSRKACEDFIKAQNLKVPEAASALKKYCN